MKLDTAPLINQYQMDQGLSAAKMAHIDETAKDFEAMFITEMMRPMFDTVEVNETFGGGKGEEIFRGFMLDEYGKQMATSGGLGIADLVKAQLIEMQSQADKGSMAQNMHENSLENDGATDNAS